MAYIPSSGSIVSFQSNAASQKVESSTLGTVPVTQSGTWRPSISGTVFVDAVSSVLVNQGTNPWIITGSVQASLTPAANQSVSGTVNVGNFPTTQNVSGSVAGFIVGNASIITVAQSSVAVAIVSGSIAATFTPPANQSVSGTVQTDVRGSVATVIIGGSIAASFTPPANQSVSGTVDSRLQSTNASVITVGQSSIAVAIVSGSIAATFTPPANQSVSGTVQVDVRSSVAVAIISGSIAATFTPPANQSVSGTVGASIIGQLPAGTAPLGSVATLQGTNPWVITGNASVTGTMSVLGTVPVTQSGTWQVSIAGIPSISGTVLIGNTNVNVSGSVVASQGTTPWTISSVYGNIAGSVVAFQGTNPWFIGSIVGTYGEDIPSTAADKGLFTLGIRNDTVASLVGADLDYTGWSTDSAGRHLTKPFAAEESRLSTVSSVVSASVTALFNSVVGLRNYVTDVMVANTGSVSTLITFRDGSTSILGFTIAPAGGGSNINGMQFPMRTAPAQDFTYSATTSSSVLYVTALGYKAP